MPVPLVDRGGVDPRDYILDIHGLASADESSGDSPGSGAPNARPWIAIHFKCCHAYARLYRNRDGTAYAGQCPKCGAPARAAIGEGGTDARFFTAE